MTRAAENYGLNAQAWVFSFSFFSDFCLARGSRGDTGSDFFSGILGLILSVVAFMYIITLFQSKKEDTSDWNLVDWLMRTLTYGVIAIFASIPFMFAFGLFGMKLDSIFGFWQILTAILTFLMIYLKHIKSGKETP